MSEAKAALDRVWRAESASMLGVLARRLGDLDRAADALQDAATVALDHWERDGVPDRPDGWLVTTAWRRAVDVLRREAVGRDKLALLPDPAPPTSDDRLALIFACCHPVLPVPQRVALTLSAAGGLATEEIAAAFLVRTPTMAQRLVRAKRTLRENGVRFDTPTGADLAGRLPSVLAVVYLLFNEGYLSSTAHQRRELAREGLDLARQLAHALPAEPEVGGLAALIEFHEARSATRFSVSGDLVLLEDQDRRHWDRSLIVSAFRRLRAAAALDRPGPYQVQAAIAAQHTLPATFGGTDWAAIRDLYDVLATFDPSPLVRLNRAVATQYLDGPAAALAEVDALPDDHLAGYRLFHTVRAELLRELDRPGEALTALRRALALATNPAERDLLRRRLAAT